MIEEGAVIDFYRMIKCRMMECDIVADVANRENNIRKFYWNAGIAYAYEKVLEDLKEGFGIGGVYGREHINGINNRRGAERIEGSGKEGTRNPRVPVEAD